MRLHHKHAMLGSTSPSKLIRRTSEDLRAVQEWRSSFAVAGQTYVAVEASNRMVIGSVDEREIDSGL